MTRALGVCDSSMLMILKILHDRTHESRALDLGWGLGTAYSGKVPKDMYGDNRKDQLAAWFGMAFIR